MTSKEKATELFDKMQLDWSCNECHNDWSKECALIAVDEILLAIDWHAFETPNKEIQHYQEVKKEIEKL